MSKWSNSFILRSLSKYPTIGYPTTISRAFSGTICLRSHYDTLKIPTSASLKEIKDAYFKLSKQYHPDLHPNDKGCAERFIQLQEAYKVLSNTEARRKYDMKFTAHRGASSSATGNPRPYGYPDFTKRDEWLKRTEEARREAQLRNEFGDNANAEFNRYYNKPHKLSREEMEKYYWRRKYFKEDKLVYIFFGAILLAGILESFFATRRKSNFYWNEFENPDSGVYHPRSRYSGNPIINDEIRRIERQRYEDREYKMMLRRRDERERNRSETDEPR